MLLLALALALAAAAWVLLRPRKAECSLPPRIRHGLWETLCAFFSREAPLFLLARSREYGPIFRLSFGPKGGIVVISDAKLATEVLKLSTANTKPSAVYKMFDRVAGGTTFFTAEGFRWSHVRRATAAAFAPANVRRMEQAVERCCDRLIEEVVAPASESGESFDVALAMQHVTVRVICEAGFDYTVCDAEIRGIIEAFSDVYREYGQRVNVAPWRLLVPALFAGARDARRGVTWLRSFARRMLDHHREKDNASSTTTVISAIAADDGYASDDERVCDIIVFLAGGYDTTAFTLSWALLELARHPAEQARLRDSLGQRERRGSGGEGGASPDALALVVKETLRLHPAAALGSVRELGEDFRAGRYTLPRGAYVNVPYFVLHRSREAFGADADAFRPGRWAGNDVPPSGAVLPFAIGRRNCVGQAMARAELHAVLARVVGEFELAVDEEGTYDFFVTWKTKGTLLFAKRRESGDPSSE